MKISACNERVMGNSIARASMRVRSFEIGMIVFFESDCLKRETRFSNCIVSCTFAGRRSSICTDSIF